MSTGSFRPDLTSSSAHIYSITDGIASGKSDLGSEAFNSSIKLLSGIWEQQASKSSETPAIAKAMTDAEATLPTLVFFAPAKPKEFSVSEDAFGKFGEEPAKLLRDNKAKRISLIRDGADDSGDKMSLLFEFKEAQEINMDPNTGCRKITISSTPRAQISFEPDGTIKLSNISGIRAEVNPGEDPLFGIKPWITVKVDAVTLSKNKDGALEIEVTGSKAWVDHTKTIPVSDEMAKHITALMDALPKVAEASKGDIPKEVREILRKGPEDDDGGYLVPTLIGAGALALLNALRKAANKEKPAPLDATPPGKPAHPETIVSRAHGMELALSNIDATIGKHPLSPNQVKGWLKFPGENGETYLVSPDRERVAVSVPSPNGTGEYIYLQPEIKVRAAKPDWDVDNRVRQQAQSGLEAALPKIVGQLAQVANQWPEKGTLPTDAIQEFGEKAPVIQLRRKQIEGKLGTTLTEQQWHDANYMRGILDKDPEALEKYNECHELRTRAEKQWHAIQSAVAKPLAEMEKRINLELARKNLPPVSLELAPLPEPGRLVRGQFGYLAGQGKVLIGPEQAVNGMNQDFLGSISHEVKHAEQDSLIIRKYAAEEARDGTTGKALLERLQAHYNKEFKIDLSERYAADILATPGALKLTNDELKRADELESAIKAQPKVLLELHRELARAEKISLAIEVCAQPTGLTKIMSSLSRPETLTQLFGTKRVPEDVAKIVQLHLDIAAKKRPASDWNETEARRVIIPALQESRMECFTKADLDYRKLFHEQEARCTETDTVDLAKHHNVPPLTQSDARPNRRPPAALSLPMGGSSDATRDGIKPDPIKAAEIERELEKLRTPLARQQAEIRVRESQFTTKERELQKQGNDQPDTPAGEARYLEICAERDRLKQAHEEKIGELKRERDVLQEKCRQLELAKAVAEGYFPPGEYMVAFPGKDAVKLIVGKESFEDKDKKIKQRKSGEPVSGEHVNEILDAIKAAGIVPDRVVVFDNTERFVGEGGHLDHADAFAGKPINIYEIYINTGASNQPLRMIYNHETGHLYDRAVFRDSASAAVNQRIEDAYKAGLNQPGSPAEVSAKYMKEAATEAWKAQFNKDMLDPKNVDILSDRLTSQENRLKYLASRGEVFAEMFKLYQEQLRISRETGETLSYKDLLKKFTQPHNPVRAEMMGNFEQLYTVLSTEAFPHVKPVGRSKPGMPATLEQGLVAFSLPDDQVLQHDPRADFDVPDDVRNRSLSEQEKKRVAEIAKSVAAIEGFPESWDHGLIRETKNAHSSMLDVRVLLDRALRLEFPGKMPQEAQLQDKKFMRDLLKNNEFELLLYEKWVKESERFETAHKALNKPFEAGLRDLEKRINSEFSAAKLPTVSFEISANLDGRAALHIPGTGKILIAPDQIKGSSLSPENIGTITHELKHAEQDALVIRKYAMDAAELGLKGDALIAKVQEQFLKDSGFELGHDLAKEIFSKQGATALTKPELERAALLIESFKNQSAVDRQTDKLTNQQGRMVKMHGALATPGGIEFVTSQLIRHDKDLGEFAQDKELRRILELRKAIDDKKLPESDWNAKEAKDVLQRVLAARSKQLEQEADRVYRDQLHEQEARVAESLGLEVARTVVQEQPHTLRRPGYPTVEPSRRVNLSELTTDINKFATLQDGLESTAKDFHNLVAKSFIEGQENLRNDPLFEKLQVTEGAEAKLKFTHKGQEVEPLYRDQNNLMLKDGKSIPISEITIEAQLPKSLFDALGNAQTKDQSLTELNAKFGSMLMQVDNISTRQERAKALTGDADLTAKLTEVAKTDQEAERRTATELATVKPMQPLAERTAVEPSGLVGTQTEQKVAEQEVGVEGGLLVVRNTDGTTEKLEDRAFNEIFEARRKAVNERLQKLRADPKTDPNLIAQVEKELAEMKAQQELLMKPTPEGRAFRERFSKAVTEYVTAHGKTIGKGVGLGCSLLIAVNAVCRQFTADGKPK